MQTNNMQSRKKRLGMGRRTKIITEYRHTGGDTDGDNIFPVILQLDACLMRNAGICKCLCNGYSQTTFLMVYNSAYWPNSLRAYVC